MKTHHYADSTSTCKSSRNLPAEPKSKVETKLTSINKCKALPFQSLPLTSLKLWLPVRREYILFHSIDWNCNLNGENPLLWLCWKSVLKPHGIKGDLEEVTGYWTASRLVQNVSNYISWKYTQVKNSGQIKKYGLNF